MFQALALCQDSDEGLCSKHQPTHSLGHSTWMMTMILNLYSANSMWHVQMCFIISMQEIEPKALKAPLAGSWSLISVYVIYGRVQITAPGRFPYSFEECVSSGLVKVDRLGQQLNVPTQGQREQSPPHLQHQDQIPSQESNPGCIGEKPTCYNHSYIHE